MFRPFAARFLRDARHYQIAALSTLVVFNLGWIDFGARPANSALALAAALLTQIVCSRLTGVPIELRSPLITGLSLSLLLRADEPWIHAIAGVIAIGSKFVFRLDGKHIWNPAGFAIVALLFARGVYLGDPFAIPLHQLQSGSLLIFTFFMISDPRTSPDSRLGRFIFAACVALMAHYMTFFMQMRPALYIALIALAPFVILIDRLMPAQRFVWTRPALQGASQ